MTSKIHIEVMQSKSVRMTTSIESGQLKAIKEPVARFYRDISLNGHVLTTDDDYDVLSVTRINIQVTDLWYSRWSNLCFFN